MKSENAIEVRDVVKSFKVYLDKGNLLKEKIIFRNRNRHEVRQVLRGISFDVKKGEAIGLIGKNGCGKSTTLKLLTRILYPNSGTVEIRGRVSSLIELGAGFHPDMTGRENIYTNASIFGLTRKEIDRRIEGIIRFSELEEFIDNPVRTYSSGMYMRLAFAVAINVDADVLLIDEILAVGDAAFQEKCFQKLKDIKRNGTTIVIVSHSLGQIEKICDRAIWIEKGLIREEGQIRSVCKHYTEMMEESRKQRAEEEYEMRKEDNEDKKENLTDQEKEKKRVQKKNDSCRLIAKQCGPDARREGNEKVVYTSVRLLNGEGRETLEFKTGETLVIEAEYESLQEGVMADFILGVTRSDWIYCGGAWVRDAAGDFVGIGKKGRVTLSVESLPLMTGKYYLDLRICGKGAEMFDNIFSLFEIQVKTDNTIGQGIVGLDYSWKIDANLYKWEK